MKPLLILITIFLIALLSSKIWVGEYRIGQAGRIAMAGMLVFTAVGHFVYSKGMSLMIPAFIPYKATIVFLTGILEITFAAGLLFPAYRVGVAWALIVFLVMILPANVYAAATHLDYQKATFDGNGLEYLWFRVPLQCFFIAWSYLFCIRY